jgi:hypothetical protein
VSESQLLEEGEDGAAAPPLLLPALLHAQSIATTATSANIFQIADFMAFSSLRQLIGDPRQEGVVVHHVDAIDEARTPCRHQAAIAPEFGTREEQAISGRNEIYLRLQPG